MRPHPRLPLAEAAGGAGRGGGGGDGLGAARQRAARRCRLWLHAGPQRRHLRVRALAAPSAGQAPPARSSPAGAVSAPRRPPASSISGVAYLFHSCLQCPPALSRRYTIKYIFPINRRLLPEGEAEKVESDAGILALLREVRPGGGAARGCWLAGCWAVWAGRGCGGCGGCGTAWPQGCQHPKLASFDLVPVLLCAVGPVARRSHHYRRCGAGRRRLRLPLPADARVSRADLAS